MLIHMERSLLVGKESTSHLKICEPSVVSISGHAMVSKDHECSLIIHFLNDLLNYLFCIQELSLKLTVLTVEHMSCTISSDEMRNHQGEIAAIV